MIQNQSWSEYCRKLPLVACVGLMDEWMTIYACLQNASLVFDKIVVCGEGASSRALSYLEKFKIDYPDLSHKVEFVELGHYDPWPWLSCPRLGKEYKSVEEMPKGSWAKSMNKRFNWTRSKYPNSLLISLHSDVIMFKNSRERIYDRFCNMQNPFFDAEWFCMSYMLDFDHINGPCIKNEKGERIPEPGLSQRKWYDYPGDWGLAGCYASSLLTVGPDPVGTYAECFYPWSREIQSKKGNDTNPPYAAHMGWWKDTCANSHVGENVLINTEKISSLNDPLVRNEDVKSCFFPQYLTLDETGYFRYAYPDREIIP